jgi:hypothetical protein
MRLFNRSVSETRFRAAGFLFPAIFLMGLSVALGADFWEKKDYKEWSDKECQTILKKSPWAEQYKVFGSGLGTAGSEGQGYLEFDIQFYTALPIRQAIAKLQKMDEAKAKAFLAADPGDKIVVNINYSTNVSAADMDFARYWRSANLATFQNSVFLIGSKGVKVPILEYKIEPGAGSFQFIFPRTRDGKPLLSADDKSLILQFNYQAIQGMGDGRGQVEFKVNKMVYNGKIEY